MEVGKFWVTRIMLISSRFFQSCLVPAVSWTEVPMVLTEVSLHAMVLINIFSKSVSLTPCETQYYGVILSAFLCLTRRDSSPSSPVHQEKNETQFWTLRISFILHHRMHAFYALPTGSEAHSLSIQFTSHVLKQCKYMHWAARHFYLRLAGDNMPTVQEAP